jgi:hypothetical protein
MNYNTVPKFSKVALRKRIGLEDKLDLIIDTHENCGLVITGNFIVVTTDEGDGSTKGKIYKLSEIYDYKTYN